MGTRSAGRRHRSTSRCGSSRTPAPTLDRPRVLHRRGDTRPVAGRRAGPVSATDAEDDPDPTPTCAPPAGERPAARVRHRDVLASRIRLARRPASHFDVTVVDTTAPSAERSSRPTSPSRRAIRAAAPSRSPTRSATDVVDGSPDRELLAPAAASCSPSGTTTVTCTATDEQRQPARAARSASRVRSVAPHAASAIWLEPVGGGGIDVRGEPRPDDPDQGAAVRRRHARTSRRRRPAGSRRAAAERRSEHAARLGRWTLERLARHVDARLRLLHGRPRRSTA